MKKEGNPVDLTDSLSIIDSNKSSIDLYLTNGTRISLPPTGRMTSNKLQPGDKFELKLEEDLFRVSVSREEKPLLKFTIANNNDYIHLENKSEPQKP